MEKVMEYILMTHLQGSFSKAAEALFISQPALSAIIKKEEDKLGVELFDRKSKPIKLTNAGEKYIEAASRIKRIENKLLLELEREKNAHKSKLTICSYALLISHFLQDYTDKFVKSIDEHVEFNLVEKRTENALPMLRKQQTNFVITTHARKVAGCDSFPMLREKIILAVPAQYPINKQLKRFGLSYLEVANGAANNPDYKSVSLSYFAPYPFILHVKTKEMYRKARILFKNAKINPKVISHMEDFLLMYFVAIAGQGIVFMRESMVKYLEPTNKLVFYKIDDPLTSYDVSIYYRKDTTDKISLAFLDYCRAYYEKCVNGHAYME